MASPKKEAPQTHPGAPVGAAAPEKCGVNGCKSKVASFGFCSEHFEQYKFGLINKKGQNVPDYEKKFEHYVAYRQKRGLPKAA